METNGIHSVETSSVHKPGVMNSADAIEKEMNDAKKIVVSNDEEIVKNDGTGRVKDSGCAKCAGAGSMTADRSTPM